MKKPWEIREELQPERLNLIGCHIEIARDNVAELRVFENGDNPWAHGCRAYTWAGTALEKLAQKHDWLTAALNNNLFNASIGNVPFTISKDDPAEVSKRTQSKLARLRDYEAVSQIDFGFEHIWSDEQVRFYFAIDATADDVFGISFLGALKSGKIVARYDVDLERVTDIRALVDTEPSENIPYEVDEYEPSFKTAEKTPVTSDNDKFEEQDKQNGEEIT